jgi:hypothetical protein
VWGLMSLGFSYDPSPPFGTDPRPFVAMMIAGFVIGVFGHIVKAKADLPGHVRVPAGGEHPEVGVLSSSVGARPLSRAGLRGQQLIEGKE